MLPFHLSALLAHITRESVPNRKRVPAESRDKLPALHLSKALLKRRWGIFFLFFFKFKALLVTLEELTPRPRRKTHFAQFITTLLTTRMKILSTGQRAVVGTFQPKFLSINNSLHLCTYTRRIVPVSSTTSQNTIPSSPFYR